MKCKTVTRLHEPPAIQTYKKNYDENNVEKWKNILWEFEKMLRFG